MAELIKEWQMSDGFTDTDAALFEDVTDCDLLELRNKAANWAFNRDLSLQEHDVIERSMAVLKPGQPLAPQYYPRIELKKANSGLTLETFGLGTRRLGVVSYYTGALSSQRAIVERIAVNSLAPMPKDFSGN